MRGFNAMSNFLQDSEIVEGWREDIDKAFHNDVLGYFDEEYRINMICDSRLEKFDSDIALRNTGQIGIDTVARITGERTSLIEDETGEGLYTYAIAFMVNPKEPGLNYYVVLKG